MSNEQEPTTPRHYLYQHHVHPEGAESRGATFQSGTIEDAMKERIRRLRDNKTEFTRDGNTLTFVDHNGSNVTLTYMEQEPPLDISNDSNTKRRLTKDMARAVDVFNPNGPAGYRAASAPNAELRATREEAVKDQAQWLDSPERLQALENLQHKTRGDDNDLGL